MIKKFFSTLFEPVATVVQSIAKRDPMGEVILLALLVIPIYCVWGLALVLVVAISPLLLVAWIISLFFKEEPRKKEHREVSEASVSVDLAKIDEKLPPKANEPAKRVVNTSSVQKQNLDKMAVNTRRDNFSKNYKNDVCGVYQIVNTKNRRVYIGESIHISQRWDQHFNSLRAGTHHNGPLSNDFIFFGEECFKTSILDTIELKSSFIATKITLWEMEKEWIRTMKGLGVDVYNLTDGGGVLAALDFSASELSEKDRHLFKEHVARADIENREKKTYTKTFQKQGNGKIENSSVMESIFEDSSLDIPPYEFKSTPPISEDGFNRVEKILRTEKNIERKRDKTYCQEIIKQQVSVIIEQIERYRAKNNNSEIIFSILINSIEFRLRIIDEYAMICFELGDVDFFSKIKEGTDGVRNELAFLNQNNIDSLSKLVNHIFVSGTSAIH